MFRSTICSQQENFVTILLPASERIKSELVFQAPSPVGSEDEHGVYPDFLRPFTSMNLDKIVRFQTRSIVLVQV
jgi:hypothetical protein